MSADQENAVPPVTLITGGASGVGIAISEYFADRGSTVIVASRDRERGTRVVEDLKKRRGDGHFIETDVRDENSVHAAIAEAWDAHGALDVVVNCAGVQFEQPLHEVAVEDWDNMMATNLRGYFLTSKHAVTRWLEAERGGALVHISSALGLVADQMLGPYSVTKSGQILLSHALAVAYGPHGIRSNAVCPGSVATESFERWASTTPGGAGKRALLEQWYPQRRITKPHEVAAVVWMLASDDASAVSGAVVTVDGAFGSMSQHNMMYSDEVVGIYRSLSDEPSGSPAKGTKQ
jgi:3-oxoacyl-[acyl-carrier protein] reductase